MVLRHVQNTALFGKPHTNFSVLLSIHTCVNDLDVGACINVPVETFNIPFESTQNKQQYGTKITSTEVRGESYGD